MKCELLLLCMAFFCSGCALFSKADKCGEEWVQCAPCEKVRLLDSMLITEGHCLGVRLECELNLIFDIEEATGYHANLFYSPAGIYYSGVYDPGVKPSLNSCEAAKADIMKWYEFLGCHK